MRSVVHNEYGDPATILRLIDGASPPAIGPGEVLVRITSVPLHPGDLAMIRGDAIGGEPAPIAPGQPRVPGFEGTGIIEALSPDVASAGRLRKGMAVSFFPAMGAWSDFAAVHSTYVTPVPDGVADGTAAHMLVNGITASMMVRAGLEAIGPINGEPAVVLQTASASAVGRLLTVLAQQAGLVPLRLVRSSESAKALAEILPGAPIITTSDPDWKEQVRAAAGNRPIRAAFDGVGGELISDLISLLAVGATIVNYGDMGKGSPDIRGLVPKGNAILGVSILNWVPLSEEERAADVAAALGLLSVAPEQFKVAAEYDVADMASAVEHMGRPGKIGAILVKFSDR